MASQTLQGVEKAVSQVVARPLAEVVAELQRVAAGAPKDPTPHLAMAIVTGFGHSDVGECRKHLTEAGQLLKAGAGQPHDAEWDFGQSLFDVLNSELSLAERKFAGHSGVRPTPAERAQLMQSMENSIKSQARLGELAAQFKDSGLIQTIYAAIRTHARSNSPQSAEYRRGMATLRGLAQSSNPAADMAGLFLCYGYRRNANYKRAIEVASALVKHNPTSVLAKIMLGRANQLAGRYDEAVTHFRKAVAIAPNDPHPLLAYAQVLEQMAKVQEANETIQKARVLDTKGTLTPFIEGVEASLKYRERFLPR